MSELTRQALAVDQLVRELRHAVGIAIDADDMDSYTRLVRVRAALRRYDTTISAGSGQPADTAGRDSRRGPATASTAPTPAADAPARDASSPSGVPGPTELPLAAAPVFGRVSGCSTGRESAPARAGKPAAPTDEHHPLPGAGGPAGAHPDGVCRWCATNGVTPAVCCCVQSCGARCPIPADADDMLIRPRPAADPALSGRHAAPDDDAATVVMPLISGVRGDW